MLDPPLPKPLSFYHFRSHSNPKSSMAPKKPTAFEQPPRADSSSDDEEEVSNEEEEEEVSEESEEEEQKKPDPKPDSSSEEDGSDSESDEEVTIAAPVKPVEVQSPKVGAKSKQKQPDPAPATAPASAVTVAKLGKKRLGESKADLKDSKKLKKVADVDDKRVAEDVKKVGEDPKKQLFQRLFSEEDEIEMLKSLLNYSAKKNIDPIEDIKDFHDIVKKSIHVDVSSAQLADKIRRTRKKYEKKASKTKEGVDKTFGKPHEQLCYDLSKKIWGKAASASGGSELKANGKGKRTPKLNMTPGQKEKHASSLQIPQVVKKDEPVRENSSSLFCSSELAKTKDVGMMGLSDDLCKKGFELLSDEARAALEEKWKNMATAELELYYNRLELSGEHVKLSLDALKASGHRG